MTRHAAAPRKHAILPVSVDFIVAMAKAYDDRPIHRSFSVVANAIPDDATLVRSFVDPSSGLIMLVLQSETFAEVGAYDQLPILESPAFTQHWHDISLDNYPETSYP